MTSQSIKEAARRFGADLVGIADAELLRDLPADENPLSIFPQAKAVIVVGRKVLRGALRGVEEGADFDNAFPTFGFYSHEDNFLAKTTYDLSIWMEGQGFEAVPLFAYDGGKQAVGVPVATSSLMQVPFVQSLLPPGKRVGVLTVSRRTLLPMHLESAGVAADTPVIGTEDGEEQDEHHRCRQAVAVELLRRRSDDEQLRCAEDTEEQPPRVDSPSDERSRNREQAEERPRGQAVCEHPEVVVPGRRPGHGPSEELDMPFVRQER